MTRMVKTLNLIDAETVSLWDDFVGVACFKIWLKCGKSWNFVFCLTSSLKGERNKEGAFCWLCRKKWINMQMINPKIEIMHKNMKYTYHMICIRIIKMLWYPVISRRDIFYPKIGFRHGNVSSCDEPKGALQKPSGDFFLAMAQWQHFLI